MLYLKNPYCSQSTPFPRESSIVELTTEFSELSKFCSK